MCNGDCSLREAIIAANASVTGGDIISLPAGIYTLTISGTGEDAAALGDLDVTKNVTIVGVSAAQTIIDGNSLDRVFDILGGAVSIEAVTVRNGAPYGFFVRNSAGLTLDESSITNNNGSGLLLLNSATLTLTDSTISGNVGGINNQGTGAINLANSTISSNNSSGGNGGGVWLSTPSVARFYNSTIVSNTALIGGGLSIVGGSTVVIKNSLLAGNSDLGGPSECSGSVTSLGYNLVANTTGCSGWVSTDITNTGAMVGPLQLNGGWTRTHALLLASPALNAGNGCVDYLNNSLVADQRGTQRPQSGQCDIGAFELTAVQFSQGTYTVTEDTGPAIITATLDGTSALTVTINYTTSNGTAFAGSDYTTTVGVLSFSPGVSVMTFTVPIINDDIEESNEVISLTLGNANGAVLDSPGSATLTIVDDDEPLKLYLPLVTRNSANCFVGPLEAEPNETGLTATGPLCFGQTYTGTYSPLVAGAADSDYFSLNLSQAGSFTAKLTIAIPGSGLQLQIRDASLAALGFDGSFPFQITCPSVSDPICGSGGTLPAGIYYVRVFLPAGFTGSSTYTLIITTP